MKRKLFAVGIGAVLVAAALPLSATAGTTKHRQARLLHRVVRLDRRVVRLDRRIIRLERRNTPTGQWFAGAVTSASSSSATIDVLWTGKHDTQLKGTSVSVAIDSSTKVVFGKGQSSIDAGDLVRVLSSRTSPLTALRIHVNCNCHFVAGTVSSVSASTLVVHVDRTGPFDGVLAGNDVPIQLSSSTTAKPGDRVRVRFAATGFFRDPSFQWRTATFTAEKVTVVSK